MSKVMRREDFDVIAIHAFGVASDAFVEFGEVPQHVIAIRMTEDHKISSTEVHLVERFFDEKLGNKGKVALSKAMGAMLDAGYADIVVLVTEAWTAETKPGMDHIPPSQRPDRKEVVQVTLRAKDFGTAVYYEIDRANKKLIYMPINWEAKVTGTLMGDERPMH